MRTTRSPISPRRFRVRTLLMIMMAGTAAAAFTARDTLLAHNIFQVEFSDDCRSMVWCEQIGGARALIEYADVNLATGLPDFTHKQPIDTIQGMGWPCWGHDATGRFFLYMNYHSQIKITRRGTGDQLTHQVVSTDALRPSKSLLNVSADSSKSYFWASFSVLAADTSGRDSLFVFRSDKPGEIISVASEKPAKAGAAYALTFPRWLTGSQIMAYPFRPDVNLPVYDMRFWDGTSGQSSQVTDDIAASPTKSHIDDFPFALGYRPGEQFLASSQGARKLVILGRQGSGMFSEIESHPTPTSIASYTLTSFEPFTIKGNKTYGAYQVYEGGGIPGSSEGEIWLQGVLGETLTQKISTIDGVAVDPEFVIGNDKVWIFYYGKQVGAQLFDLYRCETGLTISAAAVSLGHGPGPADRAARTHPRISVDGLTTPGTRSKTFDPQGRAVDVGRSTRTLPMVTVEPETKN